MHSSTKHTKTDAFRVFRVFRGSRSSFFHRGSFQPALDQSLLVQAEVMAQFVEVGGADLLAEDFFVGLGLLPDVLKEKDDLRRQRQDEFMKETWTVEARSACAPIIRGWAAKGGGSAS